MKYKYLFFYQFIIFYSTNCLILDKRLKNINLIDIIQLIIFEK